MLEPLTEREREILLLLSQGKTNQSIADALYLSPGTIKAHNHNIFNKLGVASRTQALLRAQELGLLDHATMPGERAMPTNDKPASTNLQAPLVPFIGRKTELARMAELLEDPRVRLITIFGTGGMGKTLLAAELARQPALNFPDGIFFVALARVTDARNLAAAVLDDMNLPFLRSDNPDEQLLAFLKRKRILLILDNFEHLLEETSFLTEILQSAPDVKLVVTSRERLNLSAEVLFVLGGLDYSTTPEADDSLSSDAAQLVLQQARFADPSFELRPDDGRHVRRICQLTQGMPLALVLASAWLEMLTLEEIADEIAHGIDILETQARDIPERQRSMRATIASSWGRLTIEERLVFTKLSVFRGGFTRDAACSVTGAGLRELQVLMNRSFVTFHERRYEVHELLRQFGSEELQNGGAADEAFDAHSAYYLGFLHQRDADLKGRRQQDALDEIRADYENIQAAWLWAVQHDDFDAVGSAVDCLTNFATMGVFLHRVIALFERTLNAWEAKSGETPHPVWDRVAIRYLKSRQRLSLPAIPGQFEAILGRARARNDHREIAYCLWASGNQALRDHDYETHQARMAESLAIWRRLGDEFYVAHMLVGIGGEDLSPESWSRAAQYLRESIAVRRRIGDRYELSFSLILMGLRLLYLCMFDEAEQYIDESLALHDASHRTPDFAGIVSTKGCLVFWRGEFDAAAYYAELGLDFSQDMNYYGDKSACQALLSYVYSMNEDYFSARALCEQANQDELFDTNAVAVQWGLALAYCGLGDHAEACRALGTCLHIAAVNMKATLYQYLCLPLAAVLLMRAGELERATEVLALAFAQPPDITNWMQKWSLLTEVRRELEAQLGAEHFSAIWARGAGLQLAPVTVQLRDDFPA